MKRDPEQITVVPRKQDVVHNRTKVPGTSKAARTMPESAFRRPETPAAEKKDGVSRAERGKENTGNEKNSVVSKRTDTEKPREVIVRTKGPADRFMIVLILILLCLGCMMVFSASYPYASTRYGNSTYFIQRQLTFAVFGFVLMMVVSFLPYRLFRKLAIPAYLASMALLVVVLFYGSAQGVAKRWLTIPGVGLTFQPSELMKISLVLVLAWYLSEFDFEYNNPLEGTKFRRFRFGTMYPLIIVGVASALVLLEKHLSGTIIVAVIGVAIIFVSGSKVLPLFLSCLGIGGAGGILYLIKNEYAFSRVENFLKGLESNEMTDERWQTLHGLWAIGSGGAFGLGIGGSRLKYTWVSQAHNDFIFTIWCEETGWVGAIGLLILYGLLIWRGYYIAMHAPDKFSTLTAFGITTHIAVQVMLNIAVVTDIIPNTGISLPFFSYGGTSLMIILMEMGILLSISRHSYYIETDSEEKES